MAKGAYPAEQHGDLIGTPYVGTHTLGNWQSDNAVDIGIPAGTKLLAVVDGTITRLSGPFTADMSTQFSGGSIYLSGGGHEFFYEHVAKALVSVGQKVKAGQAIGISGGANGVEHLHFAASPPDDPQDFLSGSTEPSGNAATNAAGAALDAASDFGKGAVDGLTSAGGEIAKQLIEWIWDALGADGARILLYIALVGGGAGVAYVGLGRMLGLRAPAPAAAGVAA